MAEQPEQPETLTEQAEQPETVAEEPLDLVDLENLDFVLEELEDKIAPIALA